MSMEAIISPASVRLRKTADHALDLAPGLLLAGVIAAAATYLSEHHGGPAMLFALLIGMAFNHLSENEKMAAGIAAASQFVLRLGVALLGVRITFAEIGGLGAQTFALVIAGVAVALIAGTLVARLFGLPRDHAILSAGAVAICGASAALAIASVLPRKAESERNTILTVAGVTTLSTVAMVLYPVIASAIGLDDKKAGVFIGATVHDVAQVIGAGYTVSDAAGETGAVVKLLRVSCLLPVIVILGMIFRGSHDPNAKKPPLIPWFLLAFAGLVALNSLGVIKGPARESFSALSQWALLTAVSALGVKTSLRAFAAVGPKPLLALTAQTALLAVFILAALWFMQ